MELERRAVGSNTRLSIKDMSHKSFSQGSPSMPLTIMEAENSLGTSSGQVNNLESSINQ